MDLSEIMSAVSNVGYPIAMSLILLYYMRDNDKKHDEELSKITEAVNSVGLAMQHLADKLN